MTTLPLGTRLTAELAEIKAAGLTRRRRVLESPCGRIAAVDGREMLNFASNDYLGLAGNRKIAQAMADGAMQWGAPARRRVASTSNSQALMSKRAKVSSNRRCRIAAQRLRRPITPIGSTSRSGRSRRHCARIASTASTCRLSL